MENKILPRQLCALTFGAFTVPAIAILPRAGWLWAGLASLGTAALLGIALLLCRKKETNPARTGAQSRAGRIALWLTLAWNVLALGAAGRWLCGIYPDGGAFLLIGLLLLLLAAYAAGKGVSAVVRAGAICFFFFVILYGVLFGVSLPQVRGQWLAPVTQPRWAVLPAALLPLGALYLTGYCRGRGRVSLWAAGGILTAVLAGIVTAGCLSPEIADAESLGFYAMSKSLSLFGAMERFEAVVSAALTAGGFCLLALVCLVNAEILGVLCPPYEKWSPAGNFLLGSGAIALSGVCGAGFLAVGTAIFWGVIPLLLLAVVKVKKD